MTQDALLYAALKIIRPEISLKAKFYAYCEAFQKANEPAIFLQDLAFQDFALFVQTLLDAELGIGMPEGFVPYTSFWLVEEHDEIIGNSSLRHWLTTALEDLGGHIGYRIHPAWRGRGHGTVQLNLVLQKARQMGLPRVILTCDTDNLASAAVIVNNGGVLFSQGASARTEKQVSRYWISFGDVSQP